MAVGTRTLPISPLTPVPMGGLGTRSPSANFKRADLAVGKGMRGVVDSNTPADYEVAYEVIAERTTVVESGRGQEGAEQGHRHRHHSSGATTSVGVVENGAVAVPSPSLDHKQQQQQLAAADSVRGSQEDLLTHIDN